MLWDLAVLYGKQAQWGNSSPVFADGPVVDAAPALEKKLASPLTGGITPKPSHRLARRIGS
jgi:hypothetical protein